MKTSFRRGIDRERYSQLLLKDSRLSDIIGHMTKKYVRNNLFVLGFWIELIVIIIIVVKGK